MKIGQWLSLISLGISLIILWQIRQLILLVFTSVVLSTILNQFVLRLKRFGLPRAVAMFVLLVAIFLLGFLVIGGLISPLIEQFERLLQLLPTATRRFLLWLEESVIPGFDWIGEREFSNPSRWVTNLPVFIEQTTRNIIGFFSNSLTVLFQLLLVLVLTVMLLANPSAYRNAALKLFPAFYRQRADLILTRCELALGNWFSGIVISSLFVASMSGVGLWLLQVDLLLAHALLAGLLNFIPNIGPTLSVVFPLSIAFLDGPWKAIAVVILYGIIQNLESYWLTPTVMAKRVSLLPALTLSAQIFFTSFFGILGLILALPLAVITRIWIEETLLKDTLDRWHRNEASPKKNPTPLPGSGI